jgi:hypothetical protein
MRETHKWRAREAEDKEKVTKRQSKVTKIRDKKKFQDQLTKLIMLKSFV